MVPYVRVSAPVRVVVPSGVCEGPFLTFRSNVLWVRKIQYYFMRKLNGIFVRTGTQKRKAIPRRGIFLYLPRTSIADVREIFFKSHNSRGNSAGTGFPREGLIPPKTKKIS